MIYHLEE